MIKIYVITYRHDDPDRCTALKMVRLGYARRLGSARDLPKHCLVLNPLSSKVLTPADRSLAEKYGIAVIDVSWNLGLNLLKDLVSNYRFNNRVLPLLFAGNPVNYGKATKLSSLEAIAAALYIFGYVDKALELLSIYKWGETFYNLNKELLDSYMKCNTVDELLAIQDEVLKKISHLG